MTDPQTLDRVKEAGVFAVLRAPSAGCAIDAIAALVRGGITGIEVTYSTPDAPRVIREAAARHGSEIVLGAGTVTTEEEAERAAEAGAEFLVSPGTRPAVARAMRGTGCVTMTGALTPSEVMEATELGVDIVKIFPASLGGPSFVKALRGPFPDVSIMPTGGVTADNLADWFAAGAVAVGAGGDLCSPAALATGRFDEVESAARAYRAALDAVRGESA
ncbi:bifunctional 4-hydroxy-2-oxoglutarate aldolase/2-dehydro-3-deoxy-phosphogluconate aldolase [Microbacterium suaedae]|uniref:bifunctional 4-hydroxy-2-oxoglutarate aldolase/2-dehydro-3-deoxy-phosphogluconate aldolase n=1 Tax=Microbacterium suaedae TaxID=2067813 RepID=UPI000DA1A1D0|nr:bifunctional 4-hydroxy-2-oxoglutarate aldolase/2-dehydro-3-deoxy-phosphogluconate aldolase [Microbacterium suaedae]